MNILVLGSGGREHAIIQSMSKSKKCSNLYALPGNGGTTLLAKNIKGNINDFELIKSVVKEKDISMVFVGPEEPIVNGIYDYFKREIDLGQWGRREKALGHGREGVGIHGHPILPEF